MTIYYVAPTGSSGGDGTNGAPWDLYTADLNVAPGDTILMKPGTYGRFWIYASGSAGLPITVKPQTTGTVFVDGGAENYSAVHVRGNFVTVEGLDVTAGDGHGIDVEAVHHTTIRGNTCHDCGGSGIQTNYSEFDVIENNIVFGNAGTNGNQCSGISLYQNRDLTGDTTTTGFRSIVRGNVCFDNQEGPTITANHTDGNGIIIDDFNSTQNGAFLPYTRPTLVENNLCYNNGAKGIQVTWSDNVTVRNNTCYGNNQDPLNTDDWFAELSNQMCKNNVWANNIGYARTNVQPGAVAIGSFSAGSYGANTGVIWVNNLTFNGMPGQASLDYGADFVSPLPTVQNGNRLGVDPLFVDTDARNFRLQSGSPARGAGVLTYGASATDLAGNARPVGIIDLGAYEDQSGASAPAIVGPLSIGAMAITAAYVGSLAVLRRYRGSTLIREWAEPEPPADPAPIFEIIPSKLFQDTAGTVPVTASGQVVRRINDADGGALFLTTTGNTVYTTDGEDHWIDMNGGAISMGTFALPNSFTWFLAYDLGADSFGVLFTEAAPSESNWFGCFQAGSASNDVEEGAPVIFGLRSNGIAASVADRGTIHAALSGGPKVSTWAVQGGGAAVEWVMGNYAGVIQLNGRLFGMGWRDDATQPQIAATESRLLLRIPAV